MGVRAEHSHASPPGPALRSKGFDLDDLGAAELEDAILRECHLLRGGGSCLLVSTAPDGSPIHVGLGKLLGGLHLHLWSFPHWPGVGVGKGEGRAKVGLGSRMGQAKVRAGSLVVRVRPMPIWGRESEGVWGRGTLQGCGWG